MHTLRDWVTGIEYEVVSGDLDVPVSDIVYDSRKAAKNTCFICIRGTRTDSHSFIPDVIKRGCNTLVIEEDESKLPPFDRKGINIVRVNNSRIAMSHMSAARFGYPAQKMKVIGITGTKGKTTVSYMIKTILTKGKRKVGVIGTNGCEIDGVNYKTANTTPDSYELNYFFRKMLDAGCDTVVMECSSQGFKMHRTDGIKFDYGIFLNISPDHIGPLEHKDFDEYLYYKSRLLSQCETCIINRDSEYFDDILNQPGLTYKKLLTFSTTRKNADLYKLNLEYMSSEQFTGTKFNTGGVIEDEFLLSIPGDFNVENSLSAILLAHEMGFSDEVIKLALKNIHVPGRMEIVYKSAKFSCLVDYAHNAVSMVGLLSTLRTYNPARLVAVFGCGGNRDHERRFGMGAAAAHAADFCIFTSDNSRYENPDDIIDEIEEAYLKAGGKADCYVKIPDRAQAIRYAMEHAQQGDFIAVIGKGHEDYQEENGKRKHFLDREEILKLRDELGL